MRGKKTLSASKGDKYFIGPLSIHGLLRIYIGQTGAQHHSRGSRKQDLEYDAVKTVHRRSIEPL